jgi:hypothetical protein
VIEAFAIVQHGWGSVWLTALLGPGPRQPALARISHTGE